MKQILTIDKPQECFDEIEKILDIVFNGFMAVAMDYGYHINNTFGTQEDAKHAIYELRDNIHYRLRSAKLHFYFLLRRKMKIEDRFKQMLKKDPRVFDGFIMGNPHFDFAAGEIMAIYDSIIFHLSSAFDYLAMLVQFVFGKNPQSHLQWITLVKHCHADGSDFCKRAFKEHIKTVDRDFVSKFNDYRAELIHRKKSASFANVIWKLHSGEVEIKFQASNKIKAALKKVLQADTEYCITYITYILLKQTVFKIAHVLEGVKDEFATNYDPHRPVMSENSFQIGYANSETHRIESPSIMFWSKFMEFKKYV